MWDLFDVSIFEITFFLFLYLIPTELHWDQIISLFTLRLFIQVIIHQKCNYQTPPLKFWHKQFLISKWETQHSFTVTVKQKAPPLSGFLDPPYKLECTTFQSMLDILQPQNLRWPAAGKLAKEMLKITSMKRCRFIFILWKIKMVKAAFLCSINVYLTTNCRLAAHLSKKPVQC